MDVLIFVINFFLYVFFQFISFCIILCIYFICCVDCVCIGGKRLVVRLFLVGLIRFVFFYFLFLIYFVFMFIFVFKIIRSFGIVLGCIVFNFNFFCLLLVMMYLQVVSVFVEVKNGGVGNLNFNMWYNDVGEVY